MLPLWGTFRSASAALTLGLTLVGLRAIALQVFDSGLIDPFAAGSFAAAWLFGATGLLIVGALDLAASVLLEGVSVTDGLIRAGGSGLLGLAGLVFLHVVPGIGRAFPNLRSYLTFLAAAATGSLLTIPLAWLSGSPVTEGLSAVEGAASSLASAVLLAPLVLLLVHRHGRGHMVTLPREIQPKRRLTAPLISVRESYERPEGVVRVLGVMTVALVTVSLLAIVLYPTRVGPVWLELLYVVPVLWAALNYGLRAGIFSASLAGVVFIASRAMAGLLAPEVAIRGWTEYDLGGLLILSVVGASVGSFQKRLRDSRIHEELAVRGSEAQLRAVIDNALEAIVIFDLEAERFALVNEYAGELFGWPMEELLKLGPAEISPPTQPDGRDSAVAAQAYLEAALRGEKPVFEWVHETSAGEPIACEVRLVRLPSRNRLLVRGSIADRRDILRTEEALRDSEERYRTVVEELTEYVVRWRLDGTRTFVNPAYCGLLGRDEEALVGTSLLKGASEEARRVIEERVRRLGSGERVITDERRVERSDGTVLWQQWSDRGLYDQEGRLIEIQSVGHDITERKRSEEELFASRQRLRSLTAELTYAEERERRRLATYLHDEIGQTLAILSMKLASLDREDEPERSRRTIREMRPLFEDVIAKTRTVTFELSPPVLYELGLEAAAEWIGQRICQENDLEFVFEDDGRPKPVEPQALPLLFRGARELLMNAVKHAGARKAVVSISRADGVVRLGVEDDGLGFDTAALEPGVFEGGFGLFSLRERLQFLGGSLEIKSRVGEGSRCVMTVPVASRER